MQFPCLLLICLLSNQIRIDMVTMLMSFKSEILTCKKITSLSSWAWLFCFHHGCLLSFIGIAIGGLWHPEFNLRRILLILPPILTCIRICGNNINAVQKELKNSEESHRKPTIAKRSDGTPCLGFMYSFQNIKVLFPALQFLQKEDSVLLFLKSV